MGFLVSSAHRQLRMRLNHVPNFTAHMKLTSLMLRRCVTWPLCNESVCSCCMRRGFCSSSNTFATMEDPPSRVLIYLMRHDIRLSDNPIFHAASASLLKKTTYTKSAQSIDTHVCDDSLIKDEENASFTHLLPVYVFPANQVEVSGFLSDPTSKSPYPQAQSPVAGLWRTGHHRAKFMAEGLWDLKERLESMDCGSSLHIRVGRPGEVVQDIIQWYVDEKNAGRSRVDVAGVWMIAEEGKDEKDDEAHVRRVATESGVELRIWNDEKYYIDEYALHTSTHCHRIKLIL